MNNLRIFLGSLPYFVGPYLHSQCIVYSLSCCYYALTQEFWLFAGQCNSIADQRKLLSGFTVVKVVVWSGWGVTWRSQVGANPPTPITRQTNLALFVHKITLYRFNRGAHTIAWGSNRIRGLSPTPFLAPSL